MHTSDSQTASNPASLPPWLHQELDSIRKEVNALVGEGGSKEQAQAIQQRVAILEARLNEIQSSVNEKLVRQNSRVREIAKSSAFSLLLFSIILGVFSLVLIMAATFLDFNTRQNTIDTAKDVTLKWIEQNNQKRDDDLQEAIQGQWLGSQQKITNLLDAKIAQSQQKMQGVIQQSEEKVAAQWKANQQKTASLVDEKIAQSQQKMQGVIQQSEKKIATQWQANQQEAANLVDEKIAQSQKKITAAIQQSEKKIAAQWQANQQKMTRLIDQKIASSQQKINAFMQTSDKKIKTLERRIDAIKSARLSSKQTVTAPAANKIAHKAKSDTHEIAKQDDMAETLVNKGIALIQLNRLTEATAVLDDVVARFKDNNTLAVQKSVAKALINKGGILTQLNRREEAIAVYQDVVERCKDSNETALQEFAAIALYNKGAILSHLNRPEEARATIKQLIKDYGDNSDANIQRIVEVVKGL